MSFPLRNSQEKKNKNLVKNFKNQTWSQKLAKINSFTLRYLASMFSSPPHTKNMLDSALAKGMTNLTRDKKFRE